MIIVNIIVYHALPYSFYYLEQQIGHSNGEAKRCDNVVSIAIKCKQAEMRILSTVLVIECDRFRYTNKFENLQNVRPRNDR